MWRRTPSAPPAPSLALAAGATRPVAPLVIAALVAAYAADECAAQNAKPVNSKTASSDCVSSTALLVYRGLGAGLAWTIGVDGYALLSAPDALWAERVASKTNTSVAKEMAKSFAFLCGRNMFGFASFLGIFGGVSCSLETLRGKSDLLNPFVGGFSAGLALLPGELRSPRAIVTSAALCGVASMGFHFFVPTSGQSESVDPDAAASTET